MDYSVFGSLQSYLKQNLISDSFSLSPNAVGNQVVIVYSSALSIQLWGKHFMAIPRFLWCSLLSAILLAISWGSRDKLYTILENFLPLLGYWTICFGCILFIEHVYFRPHLPGRYDLAGWQDQKRMPWGLAGVGALLIGIGFSFLGMNQRLG